MKAAICQGYGAPERIKVMDVPMPQANKGEVLIKVMASSVNSGDIRVRGLIANFMTRNALRLVLGITKPRKPILGVALSGEIEAVGDGVTAFKKGDRIFAMTGMRFGGHAQYAVLSEKSCMALMPTKATFEEAAVLPFGGTTAIHFLQKAGIKKGQKVMIYGASGAVGSSAVQVAKYLGAEVTAVCSARHHAVIQKIGADQLLDYHEPSFKLWPQKYDIIFDAVGKVKKSDLAHMLSPEGAFTSVAGHGVASEKKDFMEMLVKMFDSGQLNAVIDKSFKLDEIVQAHHYVDKGVKTGNVSILIDHH